MTDFRKISANVEHIAQFVPEGATVLDVGCGNGELLAELVEKKSVKGRGIELQPDRVSECIAKGLAVVQGNAETDLAYYLSDSFDVVILSRTLQAMHDPVAVLNHIIRIGRRAIVAIPNFGFWKNRYYLGLVGRMPVTKTLTYAWYNTPNIHFCTIRDFEVLCKEQEISIMGRHFVNREGCSSLFQQGTALPNLLSEQGIFVLEKN